MAADRRHADRSVAARLEAEPWRFDFFQAVSLLERMRPDAPSVGLGVDASREAVRFEADPSLAFAPSDVVRLARPTVAKGRPAPAEMGIAFFTLAGVQGPLPRAYVERMVGPRSRTGAVRAFLNIFHHRLVSLFYRGRRERRVGLDGRGPEDGIAAPMLKAVAGIGTEGLANRMAVPDSAVMRYAALFAQRPRTAMGLERMLGGYFRVPIRVRQFVGRWRTLERDDTTRLGERSLGCTLGVGAVLGERVWDQAGRVRLVIGPLSWAQYSDFLPGGSAMDKLRALAQLYVGADLEVETRLVLRASEVPYTVLPAGVDVEDADAVGAGVPAGPRLGWTTWLDDTQPRTQNPQVTVTPGTE